jgi:trehalose 6-phosphate synthase
MNGAIVVNPDDPDATAEALHTALSLPLRERRNLHARLVKGLRMNSCHVWSENFLSVLNNRVPVMDQVQS